MASIGLFYVGAVLFVNGVVLLGKVTSSEAAPLNLFVGALQVATPFALALQAQSLPDLAAAAPLYLFGFTYLWVGLNGLTGRGGHGLGWFCLFVAISALGFAGYQALAVGDGPFTVIWLCWAALWLLFFLVLGLDRTELTALTGWTALVQAFVTAAVPGFLLLTGAWQNNALTTVSIAVVAALAFVASYAATRKRTHRPSVETATQYERKSHA